MPIASVCGTIGKMHTSGGQPVGYGLPVGEHLFPIDQCLRRVVRLTYSGNIFCVACGRKTNKSFSQGYCYPCFKRLAECDLCIVRPETCHYSQGTCRDPAWAQNHCMQHHIVYLANSSGLKVGITRATQVPTRWFDQGAVQALPLFQVNNRYHSGLLESVLKRYVADRTNWRKMLAGVADKLDMQAAKVQLLAQAQADLAELKQAVAGLDWQQLDAPVTEIRFPVTAYPQKITSLSFDKLPEVAGTLHGIKGQYLILDSGVINMRNFSGYELEVSTDA